MISTDSQCKVGNLGTADRGGAMPKPILKLSPDTSGWQAFEAQKKAEPLKRLGSGSLAGRESGKPQASFILPHKCVKAFEPMPLVSKHE